MKLDSNLIKILLISRPRFWLYLAGTFLLGCPIGLNDIEQLLSISILMNFFYFLIPANIFLYGINDFFDEDTDQFNFKKRSKEYSLLKNEKLWLKWILSICFGISLIVAFSQRLFIAIVILFFVFLSWAYSSPPLRFKARPVLDSASNVLYVLPGLVGYLQFHEMSNIFIPIILGFCWTVAMHLFSAIPDIDPDKKAGIKTTAVLLGIRKSLILCIILWGLFAFIVIELKFLFPFTLISFVYIIIPIYLIFVPKRIQSAYWWFPYINGLIGFGAVILILLQK